ncbi:hypothetical protein Rhe02_33770 [Rhizocola hellebori]|uniref:Uncharacterized protein n=1 Tax=Rhizocola hellebori TaxID=1392758 RepID=A0A8J3Q7L8_9ACTN|nr:hypothetical protein Rhe02_33770 [Rhizocola hellebori]
MDERGHGRPCWSELDCLARRDAGGNGLQNPHGYTIHALSVLAPPIFASPRSDPKRARRIRLCGPRPAAALRMQDKVIRAGQ